MARWILPLLLLTGVADARTTTWFPARSASFAAPAHTEGVPRRVAGPSGRALRFERSSILVDAQPLSGAIAFTVEAVIRPEGGPAEQRFLHLAETDPTTGSDALPSGTADPNNRLMFEIRVVDRRWYLDAFLRSAAGQKALADREKVHPLGRWYAVAQTYDGRTYRTYVDGRLEAEAAVPFAPLGAGRVRIGARMNRIDHFEGAIGMVRFSDYARTPEELLDLGSAAGRGRDVAEGCGAGRNVAGRCDG